jgi:hypothetical protein
MGAIWSQVAASGEISIMQSETEMTIDDPHPGVRTRARCGRETRADVAHTRVRVGHGDLITG